MIRHTIFYGISTSIVFLLIYGWFSITVPVVPVIIENLSRSYFPEPLLLGAIVNMGIGLMVTHYLVYILCAVRDALKEHQYL